MRRSALLATAASALVSFASAASLADYTAALGGSSITGQQRDLGPFSVQILSNAVRSTSRRDLLKCQSHALVTLTAPSSQSIGYLSIGFGYSMRSADMIVAWPSGSSWTLSARQWSGHGAPQLVSSQQSAYTLLPQLSSSSSVTFVRPLNLGSGAKYSPLSRASGQQLIYAASSTRPSSSVSASIDQHPGSEFGTSSLDLSVAVSSSVPVSSTGAPVPAAAWTS